MNMPTSGSLSLCETQHLTSAPARWSERQREARVQRRERWRIPSGGDRGEGISVCALGASSRDGWNFTQSDVAETGTLHRIGLLGPEGEDAQNFRDAERSSREGVPHRIRFVRQTLKRMRSVVELQSNSGGLARARRLILHHDIRCLRRAANACDHEKVLL